MLRPNRRKNECPMYLDLPAPTPIQMRAAVKGGDPNYRIRQKRSWFWAKQVGYGVMVLILLIMTFVALFVITEVVSQ